MDTEQQIRLAAEFEARLAWKDAQIAALNRANVEQEATIRALKGMLRDRVPDDVEAE